MIVWWKIPLDEPYSYTDGRTDNNCKWLENLRCRLNYVRTHVLSALRFDESPENVQMTQIRNYESNRQRIGFLTIVLTRAAVRPLRNASEIRIFHERDEFRFLI